MIGQIGIFQFEQCDAIEIDVIDYLKAELANLMNKKVIFKDLELIDYKKCWDYQENIAKQSKLKGITEEKTHQFKQRIL